MANHKPSSTLWGIAALLSLTQAGHAGELKFCDSFLSKLYLIQMPLSDVGSPSYGMTSDQFIGYPCDPPVNPEAQELCAFEGAKFTGARVSREPPSASKNRITYSYAFRETIVNSAFSKTDSNVQVTAEVHPAAEDGSSSVIVRKKGFLAHQTSTIYRLKPDCSLESVTVRDEKDVSLTLNAKACELLQPFKNAFLNYILRPGLKGTFSRFLLDFTDTAPQDAKPNAQESADLSLKTGFLFDHVKTFKEWSRVYKTCDILANGFAESTRKTESPPEKSQTQSAEPKGTQAR